MPHIVQYHYSLLGYDVRIYVDDRYQFLYCNGVVWIYNIRYFSSHWRRAKQREDMLQRIYERSQKIVV